MIMRLADGMTLIGEENDAISYAPEAGDDKGDELERETSFSEGYVQSIWKLVFVKKGLALNAQQSRYDMGGFLHAC